MLRYLKFLLKKYKYIKIMNRVLLKIAGIIIVSVLFVLPMQAILSQNQPGNKDAITDTKNLDKNARDSKEEPDDQNKNIKTIKIVKEDYDERFRYILGFGRLKHIPGVLSEAGPAWMTNSFIAASDQNSPVIQLSDPSKLKAWSFYSEFDYTLDDRYTFGLKYYGINQKYGRKDPARIDFFHPASNTKRWSYFEGVRLTRYREENKSIYFKYLYPMFWKGFKAGIYIAQEWYDEKDDISFGSYVATSINAEVAPGTINWSQGGIVPAFYNMTGTSFGPAFRYQMYDWLGFHYKLTPVNRSGSMNMSGTRLIQQSNDFTGQEALSGLFVLATATVSDSGMRHDLEAVFRFLCRYTLHIGILKEDFNRTYSGYISKTFSSGELPFQEKTPTVFGIGELSSSHKIEKLEFYMKFGTSFFF